MVDIFNTSTNTWSTATLSQPRLGATASAAGNYVVFAGGNYGGMTSNVVDIYNTSTNTWSTATLSQAREKLAAVAAGNEIFFAGGLDSIVADSGSFSNVVDIFHLPNYTTISSSSTYTLWNLTTVAGRMTLSSPGGLNLATFSLNVGSMSGNAPIDLGSGTLTTGSDKTDATYAGNISDVGTLVKIGSGILTLTGSNTYTGHTTINRGTLLVNGSLLSPVTANSGGMLGGSGSLSSVTVASGGSLSPGAAPGVMNVSGSLTLLSGAKMDYALDTPTDSDEVYMPSGPLVLSGQQFADFNFTLMAGFGQGTYMLIDAQSISGSLGPGTSGTLDGLPANITIRGDDVVLNVVPEPSTLALLGGGAVGILGWRWRRLRRKHRYRQPERGLIVTHQFLKEHVMSTSLSRNRSALAVAHLLIAAVLLVSASNASRADTQAVSITNVGALGSGSNCTYGWSFTPTVNIDVTALEVYDFNNFTPNMPLGESHPVAIWSTANTSVPLVSAVVPSGTVAAVVGTNFREVPVTPTTLLAGTTYVIGAYYASNTDWTVYDPNATVTYNPWITAGLYQWISGQVR